MIILKGKEGIKIGFWEKRKLKNAIAHYNKCLELIPNHWQTKWLLGKLYQSINEHAKAMQLFEDALAIEKLNPDVAREASIAAIDAGHVE
ncbi:tetratricopeptide repeat protein, partial [Rhodocytophaga aerolata]|uniref:tetratricopeptide repeat protein n=1 Tax=Rhodocytophaga aerolata TaxID=455078 RepID=UPI003613B450